MSYFVLVSNPFLYHTLKMFILGCKDTYYFENESFFIFFYQEKLCNNQSQFFALRTIAAIGQ